MKIFSKLNNMSTSGAIITSGALVALSIFLTTWIFFGGDNNRQKLFTPNPAANRPQQANTLTPAQLQQLQQQRAAQMNQQNQQQPSAIITPPVKVATTTKVIKK